MAEAAELARLRRTVQVMRELHVRRFGDIELDPIPVKSEPIDVSPEATFRREELEAERRHRVQFAASHVRPALRRPPRDPNAVVQRVVSARERGSGQAG